MSLDGGLLTPALLMLLAFLASQILMFGCWFLAGRDGERATALIALIIGVCLNVLTISCLVKAASVAPLVFSIIDQPLNTAVSADYKEPPFDLVAFKAEMNKVPFIFTPLILVYEGVLCLTVWRFARNRRLSVAS